MPRAKKSSRSAEPETDLSGKLIAEGAFDRVHGKSGILFKNLDPANRAIWDDIVAYVAARIREKDAAAMPARKRAA
jgi:hypothetical protein